MPASLNEGREHGRGGGWEGRTETLPRHGEGGLDGCHASEGLLPSEEFPEDNAVRVHVSSSGVGLEGGREGGREGERERGR